MQVHTVGLQKEDARTLLHMAVRSVQKRARKRVLSCEAVDRFFEETFRNQECSKGILRAPYTDKIFERSFAWYDGTDHVTMVEYNSDIYTAEGTYNVTRRILSGKIRGCHSLSITPQSSAKQIAKDVIDCCYRWIDVDEATHSLPRKKRDAYAIDTIAKFDKAVPNAFVIMLSNYTLVYCFSYIDMTTIIARLRGANTQLVKKDDTFFIRVFGSDDPHLYFNFDPILVKVWALPTGNNHQYLETKLISDAL